MNNARALSRLALIGYGAGLGAGVAVIVGGVGSRVGLWHFTVGLSIAGIAVWVALGALVVSLVAAVVNRPGRAAGRRGFALALVGILASGPVVGLGAYWTYVGSQVPMINDITTDLDDPPVFWDMPTPTEHPGEAFAQQQREAYPEVGPLVLRAAPQEVFDAALALMQARGWEVMAADNMDGRIEATATSRLYGFTDEIALRIEEREDGVRVDMRSRSRLGRGDLGVNAARIRAFLSDLERRIGVG